MSTPSNHIRFFPYDRNSPLGNSYVQCDIIQEDHDADIIAWVGEVRNSIGYLLGWNILMRGPGSDDFITVKGTK